MQPSKALTKLPPVTLLAGEEEFLINRSLMAYKYAAVAAGWEVAEVDGRDVPGASAALGGGFNAVFALPSLTVITLPTRKLKTNKLMTEVILEHKGQPVICVLHMAPKTKGTWAELCTGLSKTTKKWLSPPFYNRDEWAAKFCEQEAKGLGVPLAPKLAATLVNSCGTDIGSLASEVAKGCLLAKARGEPTVTIALLKQTIAPAPQKLSEHAMGLRDALATGHPKLVARALAKCRRGRAEDPTMSVTKVIEKQILQWFMAADLKRQGSNDAQTTSQLGVSPGWYRSGIAPAAHRLGWAKCRSLYLLVGTTQRQAFVGTVNPWRTFSARCLAWCSQ